MEKERASNTVVYAGDFIEVERQNYSDDISIEMLLSKHFFWKRDYCK